MQLLADWLYHDLKADPSVTHGHILHIPAHVNWLRHARCEGAMAACAEACACSEYRQRNAKNCVADMRSISHDQVIPTVLCTPPPPASRHLQWLGVAMSAGAVGKALQSVRPIVVNNRDSGP